MAEERAIFFLAPAPNPVCDQPIRINTLPTKEKKLGQLEANTKLDFIK